MSLFLLTYSFNSFFTVRSVARSFLIVLFLLFPCTIFAQDWYVGTGVVFSSLPVTLVVGYNQPEFGVRISADRVFAGIDAYGRIGFDQAGSSVYLGGGLGVSLDSFLANTITAADSGFPLAAEGIVGLEYRVEQVGFFFEYAPIFALTSPGAISEVLGWLHLKTGMSFHF
jgi:hypothetical protein